MNKTSVIGYLKIAQWVIQSKKSFEDCLKLGESVDDIINNVNNILNDTELDDIINDLLNKNTAKTDKKSIKKKSKDIEPPIEIPDLSQKPHASVLLNMQIYNTTQKEAIVYETNCHSCGKTGPIGQRYCNGGCFKYVEDFKYKCFGASRVKCVTFASNIVLLLAILCLMKNNIG